ncbi:hypothetical protein E2986_12020, partial [Frieseomelitta varia]
SKLDLAAGDAAYSSGRIAFRRRRNERRRHEQSIRMITSVTLRDMKRNSRGDRHEGQRRKRERQKRCPRTHRMLYCTLSA